ncbi:PEP-CTERM sorting domain-containing protein [Gemmatimonas sp.]
MLSFASRTALTLALVSSTASIAAAQSYDFEGMGYGGASSPCNWAGGTEDITLDGYKFFGVRPLDLANYQTCWANSSTPLQQNGYAKTGVVALGFGNSFMQRMPGTNQFFLNSLQLGAGWVNPTTLTVVGMRFGDQEMYSNTYNLNPANGPLTVFGQSDVAIDYFRLNVDWNLALGGTWTPGQGPSAWDPYDSRQRRYEAGWSDALPYLTYYVDNLSVTSVPVPEPATFSLVAVGLAGLAGVARRRRSR